jgi:putative polyketide hydroxylase
MTSGKHTEVLVIGAGLVGVSAAVFLSWHGVRTLVVESRAGFRSHPRSRGVNPRTMELFRQVDLEEAIRATPSGRALARNAGVLVAESLAGRQVGALDATYFGDNDADYSALSPSRWCMCHQYELEPLLLRRAEELGARAWFGHEAVDLQQDRDRVRAVVRSPSRCLELSADYLVVADGAAGGLRDRLGITQTGPGVLAHFMNIEFEADLTAVLGQRRFIMCYLTGVGVRCALLPIDNAHRWMLHVACEPGAEDEFTEPRCVELVRAAAGVPDLPVVIRGVLPWQSAARTADQWRHGRVFLAGDAAHVMPPTGAFGANVGIQDAHNLAWKLWLVLRGLATPALLDTYDAERRPVAERTVAQAVLRARDRPRVAAGGRTPAPSSGFRADADVIFGYRYRSTAVIDDHLHLREPWVSILDGTPGTRAPHDILPTPKQPGSTLDLFGRGFVLVTGAGDQCWPEAAVIAARRTGIPLTVHPGAGARYGVSPTGAALVRPDAFVAWRIWRRPRDPAQALITVLSRVLHRTGDPSR